MAILVLGGRDLYRGDKVLLAVRARHPDRELASGEDNRLGQVLQHVAQRGGRVGHGVCSVQDDEAVIFIIPLLDQQGKRLPERWFHVGGVDQRVEGVGVDPQGEFVEFRHLAEYLVKVERLKRLFHRVLLHADRASGVNHKYGGSSHIPKSFFAFAVVAAATSPTVTPFSSATFPAISGM